MCDEIGSGWCGDYYGCRGYTSIDDIYSVGRSKIRLRPVWCGSQLVYTHLQPAAVVAELPWYPAADCRFARETRCWILSVWCFAEQGHKRPRRRGAISRVGRGHLTWLVNHTCPDIFNVRRLAVARCSNVPTRLRWFKRGCLLFLYVRSTSSGLWILLSRRQECCERKPHGPLCCFGIS